MPDLNRHISVMDQTPDMTSADLPESAMHSFIIKVWIEETAEEAGRAIWRGHITDVPTGERRYFSRLREIKPFIMPHLNGMGVQAGFYWRMRRWLKPFLRR